MDLPINREETAGQPASEISDAFAYPMELQKKANELRKATNGRGLCPKGVFKFNSHEEADAWMVKMLARQAQQSD